MKPYQQKYFDLIEEAVNASKSNGVLPANTPDTTRALTIASACAKALYCDLVLDGHKITFTPDVIKNRGGNPEAADFFNSFHALQDFVSLNKDKLTLNRNAGSPESAKG